MKLKLKPIYDQVVVLVGATSGAGLETAMLMAEKGARVAIVGRSMEGLNDALDQVRLHATASYMNRMQARGMDLYTAPGEDISMGYHRTEETAGSESSPAQTAHEVMSEDQVMAVEGDITNFEQMRSVADQVMQRFGRIDTWVSSTA
jgi:NAD(P)-dependent dehydrogenase (short-subunit alcohol dehydrogenase family)